MSAAGIASIVAAAFALVSTILGVILIKDRANAHKKLGASEERETNAEFKLRQAEAAIEVLLGPTPTLTDLDRMSQLKSEARKDSIHNL